MSAPASAGVIAFARRSAPIVAVFVALLTIVIWVQTVAGAYTADIAHPDETAHFVTGLMVRSWLTSSDWGHPLRFAEDYYQAYPRVAIGHWPPAFYAAQALWTLPFSPSRVSIILFMAVQAALSGVLIYWIWRGELGSFAAIAAAVVFLNVHVVQWIASIIMAEFFVLIWSLLALWAFAVYLRTERTRDSILFGMFATAAILSKQNGLALALMPPVAVLLSGKKHVLARLSFWMPALIVAVFCAPWYVLTLDMAREGWTYPRTVEHLVRMVPRSNLRFLYGQLGPAMVVATAIGIFAAVVRPIVNRQPATPLWSVSAAAVIAVYVFHTFIAPVQEPRHLLLAIAVCLVFAAFGVQFVAGLLPLSPRQSGAFAAAAFTLAVPGFWLQNFEVPVKPRYGASQLADVLSVEPYRHATVLISSPNAVGEGAIIAEVAMRAPNPSRPVLRASKELGSTNWDRSHYQLLVADSDALLHALSRQGVALLIVHSGASAKSGFPHHRQVMETLRSRPDRFRRVQPPVDAGEFELYELIPGAG